MSQPKSKKNGAAPRRAGPKKKPAKAALVAKQAGRVVVIAMLVCIITGCIVTGAVALYVMNFVKPYTISLSDAKLKFTSFVYANDPAQQQPVKISELSASENRVWVDLPNTPKNLQNAIVDTEDARFKEHEGVDWKRTVGAFANLVFHFRSTKFGGSTITQQTIKNLEGNVSDRQISVKIREIITALDLEKKASKDQILETYMNTILLGSDCYGVQTASQMYFGKDVKDLDLAQCALLAGIIQSPNGDNPYKNEKKALSREKYVLGNMLKQKHITKAEYDTAVAEKLTFVPKKQTVRSWFVDQVIADVTADLVKQKGYTKEFAQNMIFTQGLQIYTTQNTKIQAQMDTVYQNLSYFKGSATADQKKADPMAEYFQSGMMIVDYQGRVVGIEGGRGPKTGNNLLDYTQTTRQPGSSIKPIGVYAPAIEKGLINWGTMLLDGPVVALNGSSTPNWPKDDDDWTLGYMPIETAITESRNAVAVRVEQMLTPSYTVNFLTSKLGFTSLTKTDSQQLGTALGMIEKGVSVENMAGAYQIFGSGGIFTKPYTYTKVLDAHGNVLLQNTPASVRVISPETATIMNKLLQNVVYEPDGTGTGANLGTTCPVAGKTGTTSDNFDRWWCGITPDYVGACWTGYAQPRNMGSMSNPAVAIWKAIMSQVEQGRDQTKDFPVSGNVIQANYDATTGKVSANGAYTGWFSINDPDYQSYVASGASDQTSADVGR